MNNATGSLESITVRDDLTVRTAGSEIIQFCYGGDNLDATYLEKVRAPYLMQDQARLELPGCRRVSEGEIREAEKAEKAANQIKGTMLKRFDFLDLE